MKHISSSQNQTIKRLRQLATSSKHRRHINRTILDGIHLCQTYLEQGSIPQTATVSESSLNDEEVQHILKMCENTSVNVVSVPDQIYQSISILNNGVGVLLEIDIDAPVSKPSTTEPTILLDTVQDPGNMGTIIRTATAAGVTQIINSTGCVSAWSPKVLRSAMGSHFSIDIYEDFDLSEYIRTTNTPVYATSLNTHDSLYDQSFTGSATWLFGNEGAGVSEQLLTMSNVKQVFIPQNDGVESLNVSSAVAICLFEQRRQLLFTSHQ